MPLLGCQKGFSLVEVVLAVGVLAVSVLALLGMMGPAFRQAKQVTDTNAATAVIGKLNAVIQEADFADIYTMVLASATRGGNSIPPNPNQLGIFIFYTEESYDTRANETRYRDRVAYSSGTGTINNATTRYGWRTLSNLSDSLSPSSNSEWRVAPPVIAVVVSLSPIIRDMPDATSISNGYTEATPFASSAGSRYLLPRYTSLPAVSSYTLGMLPIMASVFVVPNPSDDIPGSNFISDTARSFLTISNRIFTFQAVKLR